MGTDRRCRFFEAASSQRATALSAPSGQRAELCPGHPECSEEHWGQVTGQPPFEMVEAPGGNRSAPPLPQQSSAGPVSYTHLRAHETRHDLVCRLLLEKK